MTRSCLDRSISTFLVLTALITPRAAQTAEQEDRLPRAGFFGAAAAPVTDEIRREQKLEPGVGALVRAVFPGTAAEEAGIKPGDVLTAVDGTTITGPYQYVAKLGRRKAGEKATLSFVRDAKTQSREITLKARPRETGNDAYEVQYGSVGSRGGRLRTILTRPKESGPHPALFVIQGLGGFSVENAPGNPKLYTRIIDEFARRGFVTFRVDKPGQGDSEGGPTQDVDFETELDGYRQALKALKAYEFVDKDKVIIFGHSMGGVMGPLLAAETPVKALAVYGTVVKTWYEYLLENTRRQMVLAGASASEIDEALRKDAAIHFAVFVEGRSPQEVAMPTPGWRAESAS